MTKSFSIEAYNKLLKIEQAHTRLSEQLASKTLASKTLASKTLDDFITDPAILKLFLTGNNAGDFGICIMHRHYDLLDGERMVTSAVDPKNPKNPKNPKISFTRPSSCPGPYFADRWMLDGTEFEHVDYSNGGNPSPPPEPFFEEFRKICSEYKVDILGIVTAQSDVALSAEQVFLEEAYGDPQDRMQRTTLVNREDTANINRQESAWIPCRVALASISGGGALASTLGGGALASTFGGGALASTFGGGALASTLSTSLQPETAGFSKLKCVHTCTSHIEQGPTDVPSVAKARSTNHI